MRRGVASAAAATTSACLSCWVSAATASAAARAVGEPLGRLRALVRQPRQVVGERGVPAHRVVDLRDRGRAPGHLVVGVAQPLGRGRPLAGGRPVGVK